MAKKYRLRERVHEEFLQDLLAARLPAQAGGIEQDIFLNPDFERDSHDPFLLPDMEVAVERIISARANNEKIVVWSDYDCDGIPGGVMLTEFFRSIGIEVSHYIPHRHKEGYGLNEEGIAELAEADTKVIITVDLGTTDVAQVECAKTKGIDVIITDHHLIAPAEVVSKRSSDLPEPAEVSGLGARPFSQQLPPALAVINPKRPNSKYPFDGLCGAGVAWKLVQAILVKNRPEGYTEGREKWFLDLVGMATLSDMVPLVGENRMLAHYGLRVMRRARRPGLAALLSLLRISPNMLTEDDIGFMIAPRINAASRMDSPELAARLLATTDAEEAQKLARALQALNNERKTLVSTTVKEINKRLANQPHLSPLIVMGNPNWRPGVLGLVAGSLVATHGKPVFLWGREGGEIIRGSVRSDGVLNVVKLMTAARDIFDGFGGHHASGGFSLQENRVHELSARLVSAYEVLRTKGEVEEEVMLDRELDLSEVPHAHVQLKKLAPFGVGNRKPLFLLPGVSIVGVHSFGKVQNHLDIQLEKNGARISGIAFFSTPDSFTKKVSPGINTDIVGHVEADWRGNPRVRVVDII